MLYVVLKICCINALILGGWRVSNSLSGLQRYVLIFNGQSLHIEVVKLSIINNIELLCLPAHMSSILQVLDTCILSLQKVPGESAW